LHIAVLHSRHLFADLHRGTVLDLSVCLWSGSVQIVEAVADVNVLDVGGQAAYALRTGCRYVVHDSEAGHGLRDGALKLTASLDRVLPIYHGETLRQHRLILPFIGRRGDALVVASCLAALKERYPEVTVDIAAPDALREVLCLMPRLGEQLPYPPLAEKIEHYDYYLSFEEVEAVPCGWQRSYADVFSACLHIPCPSSPPQITVPPEVQRRWTLGTIRRPRVAVHVGRSDSLRSYPQDLLDHLVQYLIDARFEVYLVGAGDAPRRVGTHGTESAHDLCGRTATAADLAAVLMQMDAVMSGDSFPMHLAGMIGVPTLALFTATDAVIGSDYPAVVAIQSRVGCSPCRTAGGVCPLGHGRCIAHRDRSVSPGSIVGHLETLASVAGVV
jgi:ADP-heptose:LPS heptosyltransferase